MDIEKIINIIRDLNEESNGIVNISGEKSLGFNPDTQSPPVWKKGKKKTYAKGGKNSRRWWLQHLKQT